MHLGIILVSNQPDAQFFSVYVCFDSLHVSSNYALIIRRINCISTTSGICQSMLVTVWYAGMDGTSIHAICLIYARCLIDIIDSPDGEHMVARNM